MDDRTKNTRRPAGFGSAGTRKIPQRTEYVPKKSPAPEPKRKTDRPKVRPRKPDKPKRKPEGKKKNSKALFICALLACIVLVIVLLGRRNTNIHALPTIVRAESTPSFAPDGASASPEATSLFEDSVTPDPSALAAANFEPEVTIVPEVTQ